MRTIHKNMQMRIGETVWSFRLTELDAFSGAFVLRLLTRVKPEDEDFLLSAFTSLTNQELNELMTVCLEHAEVHLDAGWQPVMEMGDWSWSELEHDPVNALKLTLQVILWTLDGFSAKADQVLRTPGSLPDG